VEQTLKDMRREFDVHLDDATRRSNRIREVENALLLLVEAQKNARNAEAKQYRRVEVRLQTLSVVIAVAAFVLSLTIVLVHQ
jgi:hypothetical protein